MQEIVEEEIIICFAGINPYSIIRNRITFNKDPLGTLGNTNPCNAIVGHHVALDCSSQRVEEPDAERCVGIEDVIGKQDIG